MRKKEIKKSKNLKKVFVSSIVSMCLIYSIGINGVSASGNEDQILQFKEELQEDENAIVTQEQLQEDAIRAQQELEKMKENAPEKYQQIMEGKSGINARASNSSLGTNGDILVTYDNKTSGYNHGHAAVVRWDTNYIIEAWPNDGVRYAENDWKSDYNTYYGLWVGGATGADYDYTESYARGQVGEPYSILASKNQSSKWYCSLLPYKAWMNRGFNLDMDGGTHVTPHDLVGDNNTIIFDSH